MNKRQASNTSLCFSTGTGNFKYCGTAGKPCGNYRESKPQPEATGETGLLDSIYWVSILSSIANPLYFNRLGGVIHSNSTSLCSHARAIPCFIR